MTSGQLRAAYMWSAFTEGSVTTVLWVELCPPKIHLLKSQCSVLQNATIFGDMAFREVSKVKRGHVGGSYSIWLHFGDRAFKEKIMLA